MGKITIITILATRIYLFLLWNNNLFLNQKTDYWHHMYTGMILMLVSIFIPQKYRTISFGIGLGLFIDELIHLFHVLGITAATDYWSIKSISTTILGLLLVLAIELVYKRKSLKST
jgi:hypothetical protein